MSESWNNWSIVNLEIFGIVSLHALQENVKAVALYICNVTGCVFALLFNFPIPF